MAIAVVVGVLAGLASVGFHYLIGGIQILAFQALADVAVEPSTGTHGLLNLISGSGYPRWRLMLVPAIGGLLVGPLVWFLAREARGHGVPEVMRSAHLEGGRIRGRVAVVKAIASALTIGTGGSAGREGPVIQIGASLGSFVGQALKLPPSRLRVVMGAGAAAGIAATFNAPIAGAFFTLEVILGNFAMDLFGPVVVSSVMATVVSHALLGDSPAFLVPEYALVSAWELLGYLALGLVSGIVGVMFIEILSYSEDLFERLPIPGWLKASLGGLGCGCLGGAVALHLLGNGYETIELILSGQAIYTDLSLVMVVLSMMGLLLAKVLATSLTLGSGGSGGVFSPSLFLGAVSGAAIGMILGAWFPEHTAPPGAYALVGMGAMVAATTHAPITAVLILFELTRDYEIMLPLLLAVSVASLVGRALKRDSIYTCRLTRQGINFHHGLEAMVLHGLGVGDVMRRGEAEVVRDSTPLSEIMGRFLRVHADTFYVVDAQGALRGSLLLQDVKVFMATPPAELACINAADAMHEEVPFLLPDEALTDALSRLYRSGLDELPVVEDRVSRRFLGTLDERDIIGTYEQEVLRKDILLAKVVSEKAGHAQTDYYELPEGHGLQQVAVPAALVGRSLADCDLRRHYGLNVLAVKVRSVAGRRQKRLPDPKRLLAADDLLVVLGPQESLERLMELTPAPLPPVGEMDPGDGATAP